jgi:hypothetical protein
LIPTAHQVAISGGPDVHAMCTIDALGIAAMLGHPTAIRSVDPRFGAQIALDVQRGRGGAAARPQDAVVGVAASECGPCGAPEATADTCCAQVNFFASSETARDWFSERPAVCGHVVLLGEAHAAGVAIFGHLLG